MGWIQILGGGLFRGSTFIIAVSSGVASVAGLYYSVETEKEDQLYKENLIKPVLLRSVDAVNFSFVISNEGLGPAMIREIDFESNGDCYRMSAFESRGKYGNWFVEFKNYIGYELIDYLIAKNKISYGGVSLKYNVYVPSMNDVIGVGRSVAIFSIDESSRRDFVRRLDENSIQRLSFLTEFIEKTENLKLKINYCSLTGRYCGSLVTGGFGGCQG